jgi:hypothetical protein
MVNQKFWGIINKSTGRLSRNMSSFNVFPTREMARLNLKAQMKSKHHNYKVEGLAIQRECDCW